MRYLFLASALFVMCGEIAAQEEGLISAHAPDCDLFLVESTVGITLFAYQDGCYPSIGDYVLGDFYDIGYGAYWNPDGAYCGQSKEILVDVLTVETSMGRVHEEAYNYCGIWPRWEQ